MAEPTNNMNNPQELPPEAQPASAGQPQEGFTYQQQTTPIPDRSQPVPQQHTRPMGSQAPQMPQQTQPYGAAHASSSAAPVPPGAPKTPQAQAAVAASVAPKAKKSGGGIKTFLLAFIGAILGFAVAFGATSLIPSSGGSGTVIGGSGGSTFTVTGEDVTLSEAVAQKTLPSVVNINVYTSNSSMGYGVMGQRSGSEGGYTETSLGSGVILTSDGYILTNYHVIEGADKLEVVGNGGEYEATLVGTDESSDLAVIKIDATDLTAIEVGSSADLVQGEWVMAVGSPFGLEQSVSTGIVSATSRSVTAGSDSSSSSGGQSAIYTNMIQTDAAINPGNSGGALVDKDGKLVGINTLIASSSGTSSGVGFAIPSDYAINIAQQIIDGKTPSHAQLGVSMVTIDSSVAARYDLPVDEGAYIAQVASGSGADKAGLEVGDIVTKIDGKQISSSSDVILQVRSHSVGDTVQVTYNRGGQENTVEVTLGSDS